MYLPMLFMRANPGDVGTRPVAGAFWESPDIFILAGVKPSAAPDRPAMLGQTALAGTDNTVYAHVWNFGRSAAREVVVEFYWADPSLGISGASTTLIGQAITSIEARGSGRSHVVVKCPDSWIARYQNGGHECLVVRAWDPAADVLARPEWDASLNRQVAQRNIHVMSAADVATAPPLMLRVGPLFGVPATVRVARADPATMPWLQLHTNERGKFPVQAAPTGAPLLSSAATIGGAGATGLGATSQHVGTDDQQVGFTTTDAAPGAGQAHVYRVTAHQGTQVFGGYTVVVLG